MGWRPRIALLVVVASLGLPSVARAQPGVFVDPETPAGKEYAIPLEDARRKGAPGGGREGGGDQPLFGDGIKPAPGDSGSGAGEGTGGGGDGEAGSDPRDRPASPSRGNDGEQREAQETQRSDSGSVAIEAAASDGSETLTTAGIASLVLAVGLVVGFGLRRLLRSE